MLHGISDNVSDGRRTACYMVYLTVGGGRRTVYYMVYLTVLVVGGGHHATWKSDCGWWEEDIMLHGISDCVSDGRRTACYMVYLTMLVMGGGQHATWYI